MVYPGLAARPDAIPKEEVIVVFDADMQARPNFFCKVRARGVVCGSACACVWGFGGVWGALSGCMAAAPAFVCFVEQMPQAAPRRRTCSRPFAYILPTQQPAANTTHKQPPTSPNTNVAPLPSLALKQNEKGPRGDGRRLGRALPHAAGLLQRRRGGRHLQQRQPAVLGGDERGGARVVDLLDLDLRGWI